MANYNVDIAVAIKNAQALKKFNKDVKQTSNIVDDINLKIRRASNAYEKSLNTLSSSLQKTKVNINKAAVGTDAFRKSALDLVRAEKSLNKELALKNKLLEQLRKNEDQFGVAQSSSSNRVRRNVAESSKNRIDPKFKSLSLSGQSVPVEGKIERTLALRRDEIKLQEALLALELKSAATENAKLQIRGELNRQTATAVNNARFIGQSSPLTSAVSRGYSSPIGPMPMPPMQGPILPSAAASMRREQARAFPKERGDFGFGLAGDPVAKSIRRNQQKREKLLQKELKIRQNILQVEKLSLDVASAEKSTKAFGVSGGQIGPALPRGFRLKQQFAEGGMFAATRGQRIKGAASNALIGGGFPFLFGQGGLGAAGGGIGGALGGALGGGFGFGLSIAGTAIAQQIQQTLDFRKSIRELNKDMEQMGISSNISGSQVRQLGKSLGITKEEAVKALQEFKRFGDNAVLFAEKFGGDFAKFDAFAQANTVQSALAAIRKINKDLTLDDELRFINSVRRKGVEATINQILDEMLEKEKKLKTAGFGQGEGKNEGANRKRLGQLRQESKATQDLTGKTTVFREEMIKVRDQFIENRNAAEAANRSIAAGLENLNREFRKLNDIQFQAVEFSKTFGSAFSESFKGIIKGTMSVADAFRNMFMRIADHFLDMAAQMMANSLQRGILGLFANLFNPFDPTYGTGIPSGKDLLPGSFANGGRPPVGRPSIVGERGPELFVPNSAGTIIPNHAMSGMGGSTNVTVNVDASGSSVEGDEAQAQQLGQAISQAIQAELIQQQRPGGLLYS